MGQEHGRIIGQRVIDAERTYRLIDVTDLGTYWTIPITGGALYGEGQGLLATTDGQIATWTALGRAFYCSKNNMVSWLYIVPN